MADVKMLTCGAGSLVLRFNQASYEEGDWQQAWGVEWRR